MAGMPIGSNDSFSGTSIVPNRLAVRLNAFLDGNGIAHTRAAWVAAVNAMGQPALNAALRVLLIELVQFEGDTDPVTT